MVSGESGAGKTVSAKYAMRYFAMVGGAGGAGQEGETCVERQVLASNPIMEVRGWGQSSKNYNDTPPPQAIGNAKTLRNDNSSRFGKYLDLRFNEGHQITGAHVSTYLLEKTRCVRHARGERNYHVFYQLCAAAQCPQLDFDLDFDLGEGVYHYTMANACGPWWAKMNLVGPASCYHYTNQGRDLPLPSSANDIVNGEFPLPSTDDLAEFRSTHDALAVLGFRDDQRRQFYAVLGAILNLGNVEVGVAHMGGEEAGSVSAGDRWLKEAAHLLGVDGASLSRWLSHRRIRTVGETIVKPLTPDQVS